MEDRTSPSNDDAAPPLHKNVDRRAPRPTSAARASASALLRTALRPAHNLLYRLAVIATQRPHKHLPSIARRYVGSKVWAHIARFRPLLARQPSELNWKERAQRRLLSHILSAPDRRYRRAFLKFNTHWKRLNSPHAKGSIAPRRRVMMMIGTLGPGGAERQLVTTARGLLETTKLDVCVACTNLSSPTSRFFLPELDSVEISTRIIGSEDDNLLDREVKTIIGTLPSELHEVAKYARTLASEKPEIVHLWLDEVNIKGGIAALLTGIPKIVIAQRSLPPINFGLHRPYMREGYRLLARQSAVTMINNSAEGARSYEAWLGLPHGSIRVVYNGYDYDNSELAHHRNERSKLRAGLGIPADSLVVGAVMRLSEEKCPLLWLEIAALVRQYLPETRFLIVGDGPLRATMEARSAELDILDAICFAGHLKNSMDAIAGMDMLLLTSRAEGLPNVLVEAQFMGVAAVTTPAGGAPEAVNHGKSGWVLDDWDAASSAKQIVRLLCDEQWRKAATVHGPEFAFARFGVQRSIDETLAAYG